MKGDLKRYLHEIGTRELTVSVMEYIREAGNPTWDTGEIRAMLDALNRALDDANAMLDAQGESPQDRCDRSTCEVCAPYPWPD